VPVEQKLNASECVCVYAAFCPDAAHHQLCGSVSHGMMRESGAMQAFNAAAAAQPMVSSHPRGQVPSQYAGCSSVSLPAHQPPVRHSHAVVDNVYASVPGMLDVMFLYLL